ncbi:hypothetical protein [Paraburkholderia sacchari]|uniref:hypothetical protein n=1 Tax=Paraburkholderia sacchari TaxID=159450 RepID=UPI003D977209
MTVDEASDQAVADTRTTAEHTEALYELAIKLTRELFARLEEHAVDEIAAKHDGFRPRFFSTDADFLEGGHGSVERRSALQIDRQVTPLVRLFGWETLISHDSAIWYAPMTPQDSSTRRRGRKPAQQPILRWRATDPGVLELTGFDGAVEMIVCQQQLLMRLLELGARRTGMGNVKTREISTLGLCMIQKAGQGADVAE